MTNADAIIQLTALKGQHENDATAIGAALDLLTNGYVSDQQQISEQVSAGVSSGIADAVAQAVAPLNEQISELQAQLNPPSSDTPSVS